MKHPRVLAVLAAALLLSACSRTPTPDLPAEEKAIRTLSAHWLELENAHDAMGAAALFADDGVRYRAHREPAAGVVAIEAAATKEYGDNPRLMMDWTTDTVIVAASADLAVEHGSYAMSNAGLKGDGTDRGHFVTVYRKVNGQWKVASGMASSISPEPKPAAPRVVLASAPARSKVVASRKPRATSKASPRMVAKAPAKKPSARSTAKTSPRAVAKAPVRSHKASTSSKAGTK